MALFGLKKNKEVKSEETKPSKAVSTKAASKAVTVTDSVVASNVASIIIKPRITEKSGILSQGGVYTFEVVKNATKDMVSKAVIALYKVTPVKIAMINTPIRNVFVKGRRGTVAGIRKAVVTVKKGEKIDFV